MEKTLSHWVITINQNFIVLFNTYFRIKKKKQRPSETECGVP